MAGACCGFLLLNRHKAAVFMGDTGSLALGAGLAAMATAAGMFLPLLLISGVFVAETLSVIAQVRARLATPMIVTCSDGLQGKAGNHGKQYHIVTKLGKPWQRLQFTVFAVGFESSTVAYPFALTKCSRC